MESRILSKDIGDVVILCQEHLNALGIYFTTPSNNGILSQTDGFRVGMTYWSNFTLPGLKRSSRNLMGFILSVE